MGIFFTIFYQPLFNALIFIYQTIAFNNLGLAIIFLTILIQLILMPVFRKSLKNQMLLQRLHPELKKIQEQHKNNRQEQAKATMALYREHRVNPFSGFLFLLIQLPIIFALYRVFLQGLTPEAFSALYSFIVPPVGLDTSLLGLLDLKEKSIIIVSLAAIAQYFQARLALPKLSGNQVLGPAEKLGRQMVYIGPVMTLVIFFSLPAAVSFYWLISSAFSITHQIILNRQLKDGKLGNDR